MPASGLTKESDCAWCAPGKYQTGVGLLAEANCTWCGAGKYQTGSGRLEHRSVILQCRDDSETALLLRHWLISAPESFIGDDSCLRQV